MNEQKRTVGPVTKAATAAAAVTTIVFWVLLDAFGVDAPPEVQFAATTLVTLVAGWLVPPDRGGRHEA